jgi:hypothetical protein
MVETNYIILPILGPQSQQSSYLRFKDLDGSDHVVMPDGCNCIGNGYTIPIPNILDPFTNQIGTACQLTQLGLSDLTNNGQNGNIYSFYYNKVNGNTSCI